MAIGCLHGGATALNMTQNCIAPVTRFKEVAAGRDVPREVELMPGRQSNQSRAGSMRRIRGWEFREIRKRCGFRAGELADLLREQHAPITTKRSVFRLEAEMRVPTRYVDALRLLVGAANFDYILAELDDEAEQRQRRRETHE